MDVLGSGKKQFFQEVGDGVLKDIDENPLQTKIRELEEGKVQSRQLISETELTIEATDKEVQKLRNLENRLKKIYWTKNYKDLGSALEVSLFVNKISLREFVETLNYLIGSNFNFSLKQSQIADLTMFQALFILFSNELPELNRNLPLNEPNEDPKSKIPEEEKEEN